MPFPRTTPQKGNTVENTSPAPPPPKCLLQSPVLQETKLFHPVFFGPRFLWGENFHEQQNRYSPKVLLGELTMDYSYNFGRAQN